jgi:hypothetical protein
MICTISFFSIGDGYLDNSLQRIVVIVALARRRPDEAMLVLSKVIQLHCWSARLMAGWFRMMLTVNRFELPNRNRSAIPSIRCTLMVLQKLDINPPNHGG